MVILTLFDPKIQQSQQQWRFEQETVIWVGRALENHIVLLSPLVSRRHLEFRHQEQGWEFTNHGANGTYRSEQPVPHGWLTETTCLQLARGGPILRWELELTPIASATVPSPLTAIARSPKTSPQLPTLPRSDAQPRGDVQLTLPSAGCSHGGNPPDSLLCIHCGLPLQIERSIRQYQVLRVLGRGGMGTTYLAWDGSGSPEAKPATSGLLVLKEMNANMVQIPKARELFEREAATLQTLNHAGIPRFYDFFIETGKSYLAMELMQGQDLEQRVLQQGPIEPRQAIAWMLQICEILDYLHRRPQPIIHRDIKPGNLLVQTVTNRIVLVDFGAVKAAGLAAGTRIGAAGYSAPEQTQGRPVVQSDLYAIGPTLVFLLTGQKPQRFYQPRGAGFGLVVDAIPEIPAALKAVIQRLTELRPGDRYRSARDLAKALTDCT
jgi:serine/threonine protein kinase, bacterial